MKDAPNDSSRSSWQQSDFVDAETPSPIEDDPWSPQHRPAFDVRRVDPDDPEPTPTALRAYTDAVGGLVYDYSVDISLLEDTDGVETLDECSADNVEFGSFDEPQPELSATSVLRNELYPPDESINDLTLELKLSGLFATIALKDHTELGTCRQILLSYDIGRLRKLLPWLAKQQWPAGRLLLFLEFRRVWEGSNNIRWWEWHNKSYPIYDYHILTWQATYDLVRCRSHCHPTDVIDESWFLDWEEFEIWRHGIKSFAAFAVLRSSIAKGDCWQDHVFRYDRRSYIELAECRDPTYAPFSLISTIRQYRLSPVLETGIPNDILSITQRSHTEIEWDEWEIELANADKWTKAEE